MLGLFDSGAGGLNTVAGIRQMRPDEPMLYLIDRANAPYGIKTESELVEIAEENIKELTLLGADKILIACVTASTVYPSLSEEARKIAIPIVRPVAEAAKEASKNGKIGVIATERTVSSHAFSRALPDSRVFELCTQELVGMIDGGVCDSTVTDKDEAKIEKCVSPLFNTGIDTLILGCTHFPALKDTISKIFGAHGIKKVIDSAKIGAEAILNQ